MGKKQIELEDEYVKVIIVPKNSPNMYGNLHELKECALELIGSWEV